MADGRAPVPGGTGGPGSGRRGLTLVEVLVALVLAAVVLGVAGRATVDHLRSLEDVTRRLEAEETGRSVLHLLGAEVRTGRSGVDWGPVEGEGRILPLRSFRGIARVCAADPEEGTVTVAHRGWGSLESERDSVLALPPRGPWRAVDVEPTGRAPEVACSFPGNGGETEVWRLDPFVGESVVLRPFRRTVYHLDDGALRVELGGAGRQPITAERVAEESAMAGEAGFLRVELRLDPGRPGAQWASTRTLWPLGIAVGGGAGEEE